MSAVTVKYKDQELSSTDVSKVITLLTAGKYLEDNVEVSYDKPSTQELDIKKLTVTVSSDKTSTYTMITDPQLLKARNSSNGFVLMRYMGLEPATAEIMFWFTSNFNIGYGTNTAYNSLIVRATASGSIQANFNTKGLIGDNYNGHINITSSGGMILYPNATYPLKAGNYEIFAGVWE